MKLINLIGFQLFKGVPFCCIVLITFAQTPQQRIDSLEKCLKKEKTDTAYVNTMIRLEMIYKTYMPQKAATLAPRIISLSKQLNFREGEYKGGNILGYSMILKGQTKDAMRLLLQYVNQNESPVDKIRTLSLLAYVHLQAGLQTSEALRFLLQAKEILDRLPDDTPTYYDMQVALYTNMAMAYSSDGKYKQALEYDLKGLKTVQNKFIKNQENTKYQVSKLMLSIGIDYLDLNNTEKAIQYLRMGLQFVKKHRMPFDFPNYYTKLSEVYIKQKQFKEALRYLDEMAKEVEINKMETAQQDLYYKFSAQIQESLGNYKKAYQIKSKHMAFKDSLSIQNQNKEISKLTTKYRAQQKEQKIAQLQQEKKLSETTTRLYLGITILLSVLIIISIYTIYQIRKAWMKSEEATKQRDRLFSIVAHDLRSPVANFQHITGTIQHVLAKNDPIITQHLSSAIESAATTLYKLIDNLLQWSLLQQDRLKIRFSSFDLNEEIREVMNSLQSRAALKKIKLIFLADTKTEIVSDRMVIQTIIRNLLDNAVKFTREGGEIIVENRIFDNVIEIRVQDSGMGIPDTIQKVLFEDDSAKKSRLGTNGEKGTGIGLYVCSELAKMNGGELKLLQSSPLGTTFALKVPNRA